MARYHIYVTGLNAGADPAPGIGVIRCLRNEADFEVKIIALVYELLDSIAYLDKLVDAVYVVPYPQEEEDRYLSRMKEIVDTSKNNFLIPNLEFEIPSMIKLEPDLRDLGVKMLIPSEASLRKARTESIPYWAVNIEVGVPYTMPLWDQAQLASLALNFYSPFYVKCPSGEQQLVYSTQEAGVFSNRFFESWGSPLVLQQYISGDEYSIAALTNRRHQVVACAGMKKIVKSRNGSTWIGMTTQDEILDDMARKVLKEIQWCGPAELEFVKSHTTNQYVLTDIRPRFPNWIQLAAKAGCNMPKAAIMIASGKKGDFELPFKPGILFARSSLDMTCEISRLGQLATTKELIFHDS